MSSITQVIRKRPFQEIENKEVKSTENKRGRLSQSSERPAQGPLPTIQERLASLRNTIERQSPAVPLAPRVQLLVASSEATPENTAETPATIVHEYLPQDAATDNSSSFAQPVAQPLKMPVFFSEYVHQPTLADQLQEQSRLAMEACVNKTADLLSQGKYEECVAEVDKLPKWKNIDLKILCNQAQALFYLKRGDDAFNVASEILRRNPGNLIAIAIQEQVRHQRGHDRDPGDVRAMLIKQAEILSDKNDWNSCLEAINWALQALETTPSDPLMFSALVCKANALLHLGKFLEALQDINLALLIDPKSPQAIDCKRQIEQKYLASIKEWSLPCRPTFLPTILPAFVQQQPIQVLPVVDNLQTALETSRIIGRKAVLLYNAARWEECLQHAEQAHSLNPCNWEALDCKMNALTNLKRWSDAATAACLKLQHFPKNLRALTCLLQAYLFQGKINDARQVGLFLLQLAGEYSSQGNWKDCLQAANWALKTCNSETVYMQMKITALTYQARASQQLGDLSNALYCALRVIECDAHNVTALSMKNSILHALTDQQIKKKQFKQALQSVEKILEDYPLALKALEKKFLILKELNDYSGASEVLNLATKICIDNWHAFINQGGEHNLAMQNRLICEQQEWHTRVEEFQQFVTILQEVIDAANAPTEGEKLE